MANLDHKKSSNSTIFPMSLCVVKASESKNNLQNQEMNLRLRKESTYQAFLARGNCSKHHN